MLINVEEHKKSDFSLVMCSHPLYLCLFQVIFKILIQYDLQQFNNQIFFVVFLFFVVFFLVSWRRQSRFGNFWSFFSCSYLFHYMPTDECHLLISTSSFSSIRFSLDLPLIALPLHPPLLHLVRLFSAPFCFPSDA